MLDSSSRNSVSILAVMVVLTLVAGCLQTRQSRSVSKSGFLGDYSQLREGENDEARYLFIDEKVDFSKYDKIQILSVKILGNKQLQAIQPEERKALCGYLYNALQRELGKQLSVVNGPGTGTLQLRAAITEADDAEVGLNTVTTIIPQTRLLSTLAGMTMDTAVLVGQTSIEVEIMDSETGKRLAAGVDRRVGAKSLKTAFSKWGDVQAAYDHWAERIADRLSQLRGR